MLRPTSSNCSGDKVEKRLHGISIAGEDHSTRRISMTASVKRRMDALTVGVLPAVVMTETLTPCDANSLAMSTAGRRCPAAIRGKMKMCSCFPSALIFSLSTVRCKLLLLFLGKASIRKLADLGKVGRVVWS